MNEDRRQLALPDRQETLGVAPHHHPLAPMAEAVRNGAT